MGEIPLKLSNIGRSLYRKLRATFNPVQRDGGVTDLLPRELCSSFSVRAHKCGAGQSLTSDDK